MPKAKAERRLRDLNRIIQTGLYQAGQFHETKSALLKKMNRTSGLKGVFLDTRHRKITSVKRVKIDGKNFIEISASGVKLIKSSRRRATKSERETIIRYAKQKGISPKVMVNGRMIGHFKTLNDGRIRYLNNRDDKDTIRFLLKFHKVEVIYEEIEMAEREINDIESGRSEDDDQEDIGDV